MGQGKFRVGDRVKIVFTEKQQHIYPTFCEDISSKQVFDKILKIIRIIYKDPNGIFWYKLNLLESSFREDELELVEDKIVCSI